MNDALADGRSCRLLNVIDDYNREGLGMEVGLSLPAERVIRMLHQIIELRGKPLLLRYDNGPEYVSTALSSWAGRRGIHIEHSQPGKPLQNAYIEQYDRTVRHDSPCHYLSHPSTRPRISQRSGYGSTPTNGRTWAL